MTRLLQKYRCNGCGKTFDETELLWSPNPFVDDDMIYACPYCQDIENYVFVCPAEGCTRKATIGTSDIPGYDYVWVCFKHHPAEGKWTRPDPALIVKEEGDKDHE